ncbi:MAG: DUF4007 family protein [Desulfamplus sp.]|nr:DUF4007 family protein [Desulfamplus sp.]
MTDSNQRLPHNFHQTFIPEKQYLAALLRYAADGLSGLFPEMADATGIPMGKSSGKMPAIFNYALGMGLIEDKSKERAAIKKPILTPFGRTVLLEDPNFSEELTQWLAHFNLCRRFQGADIWFLTFGPGQDSIGMEFSKDDLDHYLQRATGKRTKKSLAGPMLGMYDDPSSFKSAHILSTDNNTIKRSASPLLEGFANAYSAVILSLFERHFARERQVTLSDFESETFWCRTGGWNTSQAEFILELLQNKRAVDIDRQMNPWIITRKSDSSSYWRVIYDDLI